MTAADILADPILSVYARDAIESGVVDTFPFELSLGISEAFDQAELDKLIEHFKTAPIQPQAAATVINDPIEEPVQQRIDRALGNPKTQGDAKSLLPDPTSKRYNTGSPRFDTLNWFSDRERSKIKSHAVCAVWLSFWTHADQNNVTCLSASRIEAETGIDRSDIRKHINTLEAGGYLKLIAKGGGKKASTYRVLSGR